MKIQYYHKYYAPHSLIKKLGLNDLSKKVVNVHNDGIKSLWILILSLQTFIILLNKSFKIVFLLVITWSN